MYVKTFFIGEGDAEGYSKQEVTAVCFQDSQEPTFLNEEKGD